MTRSFKAAVLPAAGERLRIETIEAAPPQAGEVLVRIAAAALCHTDLEVIEGQLRYPAPIVLGHEAAGRIEAVGAGVDPSRVGEPVVLSWNPHCGRCFHCDRGQPILCETYIAHGPLGTAFDGTTRLSLRGQKLQTLMYICWLRGIRDRHRRLRHRRAGGDAVGSGVPARVRRADRRGRGNAHRQPALRRHGDGDRLRRGRAVGGAGGTAGGCDADHGRRSRTTPSWRSRAGWGRRMR